VALFDLDDTLFAHRSAVASGVAAHLQNVGALTAGADTTKELARWFALEELHYHRYLAGEIDFFAQRRARARGFVEPYGEVLAEDADADAWFETYLVEYERAWTLHEDTLPCLEMLAEQKIRVGVITNGELPFQAAKVQATGLSPYLEHTIASGDVGFTKPDARIFVEACARFGVPVSKAMYIGDRLHTDAIGAADAGLSGVWLDRRQQATEADRSAAHAAGVTVITSLAEVESLVTRRHSPSRE
jgi:putative hydrolase of the HAD superfamily